MSPKIQVDPDTAHLLFTSSSSPPPVPCPPEDVEPALDCSTNTARVTWRASRGADLYVVQAFGAEGHESACETDSQSCILAELLCGFTYNVSVIAANSACNVSQSGITQLKAGKDSRRHDAAWFRVL